MWWDKTVEIIRGISNQIDTNTSVYNALDEAKRLYYIKRQSDDETNTKHLKQFKNLIAIVECYGGDLFTDNALLDNEKKSDTKLGSNTKTYDEYEMIFRDTMMAIGLLKRANRRKFHNIFTNIHDQFALNIDVYPTTLHVSYELLENHSKCDNHTFYNGWQGRGGNRCYQRSDGRFGGRRGYKQTDTLTIELRYAQNNAIVPGSDGRTIDYIKCFKCLKHGHYADFCPNIITSEQHIHDAIIYDISQDSEDEIVNLNLNSTNISEEDLNIGTIDDIIQNESDDEFLIIKFHFLQ